MTISPTLPASPVEQFAAGTASKTPLTPTQQAALGRLHSAATQLEGVFVGMMLKEMRSSVPEDSLFGSSPTESTFTEMLDQQRSQAMAQAQSFGVGKLIENQLRATVLGDAAQESQVGVPTGSVL